MLQAGSNGKEAFSCHNMPFRVYLDSLSMYVKVDWNDAQASVPRGCFKECLRLHRYVQCSLKAEEERGNKG